MDSSPDDVWLIGTVVDRTFVNNVSVAWREYIVDAYGRAPALSNPGPSARGLVRAGVGVRVRG